MNRPEKTHYVRALKYKLYLQADYENWGDLSKAQPYSEEVARSLANILNIFVASSLGRIETVKISDCQ